MRACISFLLLTFSLGCIGPFDVSRDIRLEIESIETPEFIDPGEPLTIKAVVITGGCKRFERLVATREGQRISLAAWGEDSSGGFGACTTDIRFEPHDYVVTGPFSGPLTVVAHQRDGVPLERIVRIR